ncbi:hypothetical protein [Pseudomonas sp. GZD-222]|uniref:hypothetical protein n=1 Tax=Pseudomonas sp. GZD-222 TaxID=3404805 RepID=UPI003BB6BD60
MKSNSAGKSVRALAALLESIVENPSNHLNNHGLRLSLISQGAICRFESLELGIHKVSLNTFKRHCAEFIPGGFGYFDELRTKANISLKKTSAHGLKKRKTQQELIAQLRQENTQLNLDLLALTKLLRISMNQTRSFVDLCSDEVASKLYVKESRELLDMLSVVGSLQGRAAP